MGLGHSVTAQIFQINRTTGVAEGNDVSKPQHVVALSFCVQAHALAEESSRQMFLPVLNSNLDARVGQMALTGQVELLLPSLEAPDGGWGSQTKAGIGSESGARMS